MSQSFKGLGLPEPLTNALFRQGIKEPFPVQSAAIPLALDGSDLLGKAPTGSGKTLAFGLPVLSLVTRAESLRPKALVLAPTRELADQIKADLAPLAKSLRKHVFAIYGGVAYGAQRSALRRGVDVLVATPGRLEDLIAQRLVDLSKIEIVVIDEADRMADMGFIPAVRRILDLTPRRRQTMLFSATLDGDVSTLSKKYQTDPVRIEAKSIRQEAVKAVHHFWNVKREDRVSHTAEVVSAKGRSIVFTRTRRGADRLAKQLDRSGVAAVAMHGGRSQSQRTRALKSFASGRTPALVATDVAARGIHVDDVACVIHYDLAGDHKDYT
ncbi:MAG: DEAD/DEAH box helicase, partial [Acidimicrobiia bacterium]